MESQLPRRTKPAKNDFDTNPKAVRQWVDDLPLLNTDKTRELLDDALEQINNLDISPSDRYRVLELLSVPVCCVTDALKNEFIGKQIPLPNKHRLKARQCLTLYDRMATGYEIMAADLGRMTGRHPRLAIALYRALRYLSKSLLTNYQIYLQQPTGLWKSLHTVYTAACKADVTSRTVTDATLSAAAGSSIDALYKRVLLLSLACPYRLHQKEIHYVYNALIVWSAASRLSPATDRQDNGLFAVNLLSDEPPAYRALNRSVAMNDYRRILDTSGMADMLRMAATDDSRITGNPAGSGDIGTVQRLMLAWGVMPKRRFSRHASNSPVKLILGLDAIHRLAEGPEITTTGGSSTGEDIHDRQYLQDPAFENYAATGDPEAEAWKIADLSASGYCLLQGNTQPADARVGDLVAVMIATDAAAEVWHLGVIRRIKFSRDRGLELGIQLLSPGARPVWACVCRNDINATARMKGFLLPEVASINQAASLLLPSLPFQVGCLSTLEQGNRKETIVLTQQLENTGIFGQYHFTLAE